MELSERKTSVKPLSEYLITHFIGGRGINLKLLYDEVGPEVGPLDPRNRFIIGAGPLVGTIAPSSGRVQCTTKSPLTGILGDSNMGGFFGAEMKFAGYDHFVIAGQSEKPVYLWIHDDQVEIREAAHLWGLDTWETTAAIQRELEDRDIQVLTIGPAGENLVKFACLISNLGRAAGRGGCGAVWGSKRLKAIAVRGTRRIDVARPQEFLRTAEGCFQKIYADPGLKQRSIEGTPSLVLVANAMGWLGYKNLQCSTNEEIAKKLSAEAFLKYCTKSKACFNCPVHCSHYYVVKDGPFKDTQAEGLEYIGISGFGLKTGVDYYPAVLKANELANRYGLDAGSLGDVIAWAMECFDRGMITREDAEGMPLQFGDYESMLTVIPKIARRKGIGDILAEGVVGAAKKIGKGSMQFAHHVKGLSLMIDIRTGYGYALGHIVSNIGAHHSRGAVLAEEGWLARSIPDEVAQKMFGTLAVKNPYTHEAKEKTVQWYERGTVTNDCVGMCKFVVTPAGGPKVVTVNDIATMLSQATGIPFREEDLEIAVERILALERAFNAREGVSRKDDTLPPRMWETPETGPHKDFRFDKKSMGKLLDQYYALHGWNENGIPERKTLEKLGLTYVAEELDRLGKYETNK